MKYVLSIIAAMSLYTMGQSQAYSIKAGLNLADVHVPEGNLYSMNTGFHAGVTLEIPISDLWSFETGALLSMKGFKFDLQVFDSELSITSRPFYIDVPMLARRYVNIGDMKMFATLGPYMGVGIFGENETKVTVAGQTESEQTDIAWGSTANDDIERFEYGLTAGIGLQIRSLEFGVSYQMGLTNNATINDENEEFYNRVIQASVAYRFAGSRL